MEILSKTITIDFEPEDLKQLYDLFEYRVESARNLYHKTTNYNSDISFDSEWYMKDQYPNLVKFYLYLKNLYS